MDELLAKLPAWLTPALIFSIVMLVASFGAIILLGRMARWLGLGTPARIDSTEQAIQLANEAYCGFDGNDAAIDRNGTAAIVRNARGDHVIVRGHGNHFAARAVGTDMQARLDRHLLIMTANDPFGDVVLDLGDRAAPWAAYMRKATA